MTLLFLYVALALGVSFLCSIMEAVLLSISSSYLARLEKDDPPLAVRLKAYKDQVDQPLAAILSLNTIAHTVGAAGAGAQAAKVFGEAYLGVISAVLTLLILVLSEIIPKTLGAAYWRQLAGPVALLLKLTLWLMWPLVKMAEGLTRLLTRGKKPQGIQREEFIALADHADREGLFHRYESRILTNLFVIRELRTRDIMTPRTVVFALERSVRLAELLELDTPPPFSRIPLYSDGLDQMEGFVLKQELLQAAHTRPEDTLATFSRPLLTVDGELSVHDLFERLMNEAAHIALVVDEYGSTQGVVTMEDVIETLIGLEIVDEVDTVEDMQALARKQWQQRAKQHEGLMVDLG